MISSISDNKYIRFLNDDGYIVVLKFDTISSFVLKDNEILIYDCGYHVHHVTNERDIAIIFNLIMSSH